MNLLTILRTQPTSVRVLEEIEPHDVAPYRHKHKRYPWPSRMWQGAWFSHGHIIRCWLDEVLMSDIRKAKGAP
jgi:hypothetical protein